MSYAFFSRGEHPLVVRGVELAGVEGMRRALGTRSIALRVVRLDGRAYAVVREKRAIGGPYVVGCVDGGFRSMTSADIARVQEAWDYVRGEADGSAVTVPPEA